MFLNQSSKDLYAEYVQQMRRIADVKYSIAILGWDQETYLPPKGAACRGQQITTLTTMAHELFSSDQLGNILQTLAERNDLDEQQKYNIRLSLEDYVKNKKYTSTFVANLSNATNNCYHAWIKARRENDFSYYQSSLQKMIALKKEETHILGFEKQPYDALLNEYEKGITVNDLDNIFSQIKKQLIPLIKDIAAKPAPENNFLYQHFDKQQQWNWGIELLKEIGFDFEAGRQDISEHPFTTSFNTQDVRITTRIDENDFGNMTWSCLHEGGHALYEQGLPQSEYGLPAGEAASLGIHESQSRLWENNIGRSLVYWQCHFPRLQKIFPQQLAATDTISFYKGINKVTPSFIRTEADELTYHLHIIIRYEIEKEIINNTIDVKELPAAWNKLYHDYLQLNIPDDRKGILQDIHWCHGSFGYFPTYSLGSMYAAQFFKKATKDIPALTDEILSGNTSSLLKWLRENIHSFGRQYTSVELCKKVTGEPLNAHYFMEYVQKKYQEIYIL